jgi:hypothetical protein
MVVTCKIRIERYTWKFRFYLIEDLMQPVILELDFFCKDQNIGGHSGRSGVLELTLLINYL